VVVVSGDNARAVAAVAREAGIDEVVAEAAPATKVEVVERLRKEGRVVAFVGDGVNDAPALAAADVGIAVASGTDVAVESAGMVLMRSDPRAVVTALALSRRTFRTIRQNLGWAFAYNLTAIPLAAAGVLSPAACGVSMAVSSVGVMANSLRLARFTPLPEEAPRVSPARSDESKFRPRRLLPDAKGTGMAATYEKGTLLTCEHEGCGCRVLIQEQCNCSGADNSNYTCGCGAKLIPVSGS